jgi:hypothetical protein
VTATIAPPVTGLDWVTFSDEEHGKSCEWRKPECSAEAVYLLVAAPVRNPCNGHVHLACLPHKDAILQELAERRGWNCSGRCGEGARSRVVRIEPLRGDRS